MKQVAVRRVDLDEPEARRQRPPRRRHERSRTAAPSSVIARGVG
ncbi:MAG: hypothetical protein U0232_05830 [Thermomicrobiales bacterium]